MVGPVLSNRQTNYDPILRKLDKLEGTTASPRKEMFPSWTWADWRPRVELDGRGGNDNICIMPQDSTFTSLVDLSVELDDGRIVSWARGHLYDSDVSWLITLPNPPRILHIQRYTANPQLRYIREKDWAKFNKRSILPIKEAYAHSGNDSYPKDHRCDCAISKHRWIWIDADGQHLQPLLQPAFREQPRCWRPVKTFLRHPHRHPLRFSYNLSVDAFQILSQRHTETATMKPYTECTFDFRVIVLGCNGCGDVFYMMLMKAPGTVSQTETFERLNVIQYEHMHLPFRCDENSAKVKELLAELTGERAGSFRGTPWVKINTRVA